MAIMNSVEWTVELDHSLTYEIGADNTVFKQGNLIHCICNQSPFLKTFCCSSVSLHEENLNPIAKLSCVL